jgi:hypothetical protein
MRAKLEALAALIADYRDGEVAKPDADHVERWVRQFDADEREPLLDELLRIWPAFYLKRQVVERFLQRKLTDASLVGANPAEFWARTTVLDIQMRGGSQRALRELLRPLLYQAMGLSLDTCGGGDRFIYFDDILFTGDRIERDISTWLPKAPLVAHVDIVVFAAHAYGRYQLEEKLKNLSQAGGKSISFSLLPKHVLENRRAHRDDAQVLWPVSLPLGGERFAAGATGFVPRSPGRASKLFPSEPTRHLVEQALLKAGLKIVGFSRDPAPRVRPLGYGPFGVGFGSLLLTYRNCPNNAPLALWWGGKTEPAWHPFNKWYPLVPRKTYDNDADF